MKGAVVGNPASDTAQRRLEETPRDWFCTFGSGQRLVSVSQSATFPEGDGIDAQPFFVVVHGTYDQAVAEMNRMFGGVWSTLYPNRTAAGVDTFGLQQLRTGQR